MNQKKKQRLSKTDLLLEQVRTGGREMTWREQIELTARLSLPAILAQMAHILMEYIDASMVGRLGAIDSASIGLVATTTWLFWGVTGAVATGFSVQVAQVMLRAQGTCSVRHSWCASRWDSSSVSLALPSAVPSPIGWEETRLLPWEPPSISSSLPSPFLSSSSPI